MKIKLLLLIILALLANPAHAYQDYNQAHGTIYTYGFSARPNPVLMNRFLTTLQRGYALRSQYLHNVQPVVNRVAPVNVTSYVCDKNGCTPMEDNLNGVTGPYGQ